MTRPGVSVAMCTYNGARFLEEQLESIAAQTRAPDELVVCDDRSRDETVAILERFARRAPFPVRLEINDVNLGSTRNFEKAIGLCRGEIIFLADQDDVWLPAKVSILEQTLKDHPEAGYAFCNADLIDEQGHLLGRSLWESLRMTPAFIDQFRGTKQFPILLKRTVATGATMGFRATLREAVLPISPYLVHDYWISLIASCAGFFGLPSREKLIRYRSHPSQQVGTGSTSIIQKIKRARQSGDVLYSRTTLGYLEARQHLEIVARQGYSYPLAYKRLLDTKIEHSMRRAAAHSSVGIMKMLRVTSELLTGRYSHFSDSWRSVVRDLCF